MKFRNTQSGFAAVELVLLLVVVVLIGVVGYRMYKKPATNTPSPTVVTVQSAQPTVTVAPAPAVKDTSDLDKASATLDQTDPSVSNSSDSSQLDTQLSNF